MKILCLISLQVLLLTTSTAYAAIEAASAIRQYDDGKTKVMSPKLEVKGTFLGDRANVGAGYAMDVVSSASSDVTSYGTKPIKENRQELSANLGWLADGGSYSWSVVSSEENDYKSMTYGVGATRELFEKNTILGIGTGYGDDTITSSSNKNFKRYMTNSSYSFSATQILSRTAVIQLLYDLRVENGYLASPYRKARIQQASGTIIGVPENHPKTRNRNSVAIKFNYFFKPLELAFSTSFRAYLDSWGVTSGTLEERITKDLSSWLSLALSLRYYNQMQASFYKDIYEAEPGPFYTGNKTLAAYSSYQIGLRPLIKFSDDIKFYLKGEYYSQSFQNHTALGKLSDTSDDKKLKLEAFVVGAGIETRF